MQFQNLRVVDTHGVLQSGAQVGNDRRNDTDESGSGSTDESSSRGNGNKTGNGTSTKTDDGPFTLESEIHNHPGDGAGRSSQVCVENGKGSLHGSGETRSTVEPEPSDPEEDCTENDLGYVGWLENDTLGPVTSSVADKVRVGKTAGSGSDFNGHTSGVVEDTPFESPTVRRPDPMGQRVVDQRGPAKDEDHSGKQPASLGGST